MKTILAGVAVIAVLSGCASVTGRGLVPGQSTAQNVQALMGKPAEQLKAADGDTIWFYPNQPFGRTTYAVRVAPDGRVRSVEQVLTEENVRKLVPGVTTRAQVREVVGPPYESSRFERQQRESWGYTMYNLNRQDFFLFVQMSDDGIVREVMMLEDRHKDQGDAGRG